MTAVIVNSVLGHLFRAHFGTKFSDGAFVYDTESTDVYHRLKYSNDVAFAQAYCFGSYLTRRVDLIFDLLDSEEGAVCLYFLQEDNIAEQLTISGYWIYDKAVPNVGALYSVANAITRFLSLPTLPAISYCELLLLFDKVKKLSAKSTPTPQGSNIRYGDTFCVDNFKYRLVYIPPIIYDTLIACYGSVSVLLKEEECLLLGIRQSPGWEHLMTIQKGHVMLFRRSV